MPSAAKPSVAAPGGDRRGSARDNHEASSPQAGSPFVRPESAGAAAFGHPAPSSLLTAGITPSVARALLYQAPTGQTETTIDRSQWDNRPAVTVANVTGERGISVKQGNGQRGIGISIRGSNARNGFGIRNLVIFDDGFPVTQPDGLSRSDLIDPRAYGAIDVIRRGRRRRSMAIMPPAGAEFPHPSGRLRIDGVEYGADGGSFGYLNNYLAARQEGRQFRILAVCQRRAG